MKYFLLLLFVALLMAPYGETNMGTDKKNSERFLEMEGKIHPRREVIVWSGYFGFVDEVYVSAGDKVLKGQKIAKIKPILNYEKLVLAKANYRKANVEYNFSKDKVDRLNTLASNKLISESEFNEAKKQLDIAYADKEMYEKQIRFIVDGDSQHGKINNNIIYANHTGTVIDVNVGPGDHILAALDFNKGTPVARIANMDDVIFSGKVSEDYLQSFTVGQDIYIRLNAFPSIRLDAKVESVSLISEEHGGEIFFTYTASIIGKDNSFMRSGLSGKISLPFSREINLPL